MVTVITRLPLAGAVRPVQEKLKPLPAIVQLPALGFFDRLAIVWVVAPWLKVSVRAMPVASRPPPLVTVILYWVAEIVSFLMEGSATSAGLVFMTQTRVVWLEPTGTLTLTLPLPV